MAEPPGAPHRTTGSTLLHPLSALLGIPLDQVRLRAAPERRARAASSAGIPGRQGRGVRRCHAVPAQGPLVQRGEPAVGAGLGGGRAAVTGEAFRFSRQCLALFLLSQEVAAGCCRMLSVTVLG